jgi:hypothetical protein
MANFTLDIQKINPSLLSSIWTLFGWTHQVNFTMQPQQQSQWCWSATATSTAHFYDSASAWTQCSLVNAELGQSSCCNDGSTSACNQPWFLNNVLDRTQNLRSWSGTVAMASEVDAELAAGNPVGIRIGWFGGGGHFMVLSAYNSVLNQVEVRDPIFGTSVYDYDDFRDNYQDAGSWTHTYFLKSQPLSWIQIILKYIRMIIDRILAIFRGG